MRYEHEKGEEWIRWFMSPDTKDEAQLRAALASIPRQREAWTFVETRLFVTLDEAKEQIAGIARSVVPGQEIEAVPASVDPTGERWRLLELKERLYQEERNNRSVGGPRDSFSGV